MSIDPPVLTSISYDGKNTKAFFKASGNIPYYTAYLNLNGRRVASQSKNISGAATTGQITISKTLAGDGYTVTVVAKHGNKVSSNSNSLPVLTPKLTIDKAAYDGVNVHVQWEEPDCCAENIVFYTVTLYQKSRAIQTVTSTTLQVKFAPNRELSPLSDFKASVAPSGKDTDGQQSKSVVLTASDSPPPPNQSPTYTFSLPTANVQPYITRSSATPPTAQNIVLWLPELFEKTQERLSITGTFTLARSDNKDLPYNLTIKGDGPAWQFNNIPIREDLRADYLGFLAKVEEQSLKPGALNLLRQVVANSLPLTFTETLYYRYGFDPDNGYINLQSGMRLQIDSQSFQMMGPQFQNSHQNGFIGSGTAYYDIENYLNNGRLNTGANPFLSRILYNGSRQTVTNNSGGGGGVIDWYANTLQRPFYRLLYPLQFTSSDSHGADGPAQGVALLATDSYTRLEEATAIYLQQGDFDGLQDSQTVVTFFRGRTIVTPQIPVQINGQSTYIAVGTTLRQALAGFAALPFGENVTLVGLTAKRNIGNVVDDPSDVIPNYSILRNNPISFDGRLLPQYDGGIDGLDLPLLQGDSLTVEVA